MQKGKTKLTDSKEPVRSILRMITKKSRPQKTWVDKGTEFDGEFEIVCKAERIQIYSTMSAIRVVFAERTKRSLKSILHRYLEDFGYKYIHKISQFVTTPTSRKNCSINLISKIVETSNILSMLYSKPLREEKTQVEDWRPNSHLKLWVTLQEQLEATLYSGRFWNCCDFFQRTSNLHNKKWTGRGYPR